jgi:hypothetical protein
VQASLLKFFTERLDQSRLCNAAGCIDELSGTEHDVYLLTILVQQFRTLFACTDGRDPNKLSAGTTIWRFPAALAAKVAVQLAGQANVCLTYACLSSYALLLLAT